MKKTLKTLLLSLSCIGLTAAATAFVGCKNPEDSSSSSTPPSGDDKPASTLKVDFVEGEGYSFISETKDGDLVAAGDVVSFSVKVGAFYTGYPVVSVNGESIAPDANGEYTVNMNEAIEVTVSGVRKDVSNMAGSGSFDDAYVVSRPIDLLYIAEQVNKGVQSYVTGAYVLANDIDCGGEELQIIGDMSTENAFFSGCFTCHTDPNTGEMISSTISNFVINSESANYVGLFGTVYADLSVQSSGLFYGINLDNFTINASLSTEVMSANRSISAGGLIGYGVGANLYVCSATNGEINVYGDTSYFSFAGGLIGYQQAFYMADYDMNFPSEIVYSHAGVDINIMKGMALYAGGITGYIATNVPSGSTAFIHNSYSTGNVSGALRSGGIVGGLGQYTSVSNCYATGEIYARATQSLDDILVNDDEYCYANAGGIVGFAENDTIANDCFFAGSTSASAASAGCALTHDIIGGGHAKGYTSASSQKYVINNCITPAELSGTMEDNNSLFKTKFSWVAADWVFSAKGYPTINYESSSANIKSTMTLYYVTADGNKIKVKGNEAETITYFDTANQSINIYAPVGNYFITGGLARTIQSDNYFLSYGYFFDEACTQKVPYSYVPQRNIVLYVGFADPEPILGTHDFIYENSTEALSITFDASGFATYSDGKTEQISYYFYDGETILIEGARLARYFNGAIVIDEDATDVFADANFDLYRYNYYDFTGSMVNGTLELYDGVYFTKDTPLRAKSNLFRGEYYVVDGEEKIVYKFYGEKATSEKGSSYIEYTYTKAGDVITLKNDTATVTLNVNDLQEFDGFKGVWTKSATINKTYAFDGMGGWTYQYVSYERSSNGYANTYEKRILEQKSGTYTIVGGVLKLDDHSTTASFDGNGFLIIQENGKKQTYYTANSYVGTWKVNDVTIHLLGIGKDGFGEAVLDYGDGIPYNLVYELSETNGYICLYWPHDRYTKDALFGYFVYDTATNTLLATLSDANELATGYSQGNLFVIDDYDGEWICDADEFKNIEFTFNGNGLYGFLYGYSGMEGKLILVDLETKEKTELTYTLDSTLKGYFAYEGRRYVMEYDEDAKAVILTADGVNAQLQRKDALAKIEFVDTDGNTYYFDGRSNLTGVGGALSVNGTPTYTYIPTDNYWTIQKNGSSVGTIRLAANEEYYELLLNGTPSKLYIRNQFIGEWAIGGAFGMLKIGPTDLNGNIQANFKGYPVQLETLEPNLLTFKYKEDNMPITYYVFVVNDSVLGYDVLVLSQYPNLYSGSYSICTKAHELYGEWVRNDGDFTVGFDGITSGQYSYGVAYVSRGGLGKTDYYYRVEDNGIMMWSQITLGGKTQYFKIEMLDLSTATPAELNADDVYVKRNAHDEIIGAFRRLEADGLIFTTAKDDNNNVYFFDGGNVDGASGNLYVNDVLAYTYVIKSYNDNSTATLEITDVSTKVKYTATLDYSISGEFKIIIGNAILEENA